MKTFLHLPCGSPQCANLDAITNMNMYKQDLATYVSCACRLVSIALPIPSRITRSYPPAAAASVTCWHSWVDTCRRSMTGRPEPEDTQCSVCRSCSAGLPAACDNKHHVQFATTVQRFRSYIMSVPKAIGRLALHVGQVQELDCTNGQVCRHTTPTQARSCPAQQLAQSVAPILCG
jgi:hypothetical protein